MRRHSKRGKRGEALTPLPSPASKKKIYVKRSKNERILAKRLGSAVFELGRTRYGVETMRSVADAYVERIRSAHFKSTQRRARIREKLAAQLPEKERSRLRVEGKKKRSVKLLIQFRPSGRPGWFIRIRTGRPDKLVPRSHISRERKRALYYKQIKSLQDVLKIESYQEARSFYKDVADKEKARLRAFKKSEAFRKLSPSEKRKFRSKRANREAKFKIAKMLGLDTSYMVIFENEVPKKKRMRKSKVPLRYREK